MATKVVKMCDLSVGVAIQVFIMLNPGKIMVKRNGVFDTIIITDVEPKNLVYPEGWYYAKGCFRNKHTSTTGMYGEAPMLKSNGKCWGDSAKYCTLHD